MQNYWFEQLWSEKEFVYLTLVQRLCMLKNQVYSEGSSALMNNPHFLLVTDLGICVLFAANTQHLSANLASNKYFQYYIQSYLWAFLKL